MKLSPSPDLSTSQGKVDTTTNGPVKGKGEVTAFSATNRTIEIDGSPYVLAMDLVVKDKDGNVLVNYLIEYLRVVHRVEFVRIKGTIKEITVLQLTS